MSKLSDLVEYLWYRVLFIGLQGNWWHYSGRLFQLCRVPWKSIVFHYRVWLGHWFVNELLWVLYKGEPDQSIVADSRQTCWQPIEQVRTHRFALIGRSLSVKPLTINRRTCATGNKVSPLFCCMVHVALWGNVAAIQATGQKAIEHLVRK